MAEPGVNPEHPTSLGELPVTTPLPGCVSAGCVAIGAFFVCGFLVFSWIGPLPTHSVTVFDAEYWAHNWVAMVVGCLCGYIAWLSARRRWPSRKKNGTP